MSAPDLGRLAEIPDPLPGAGAADGALAARIQAAVLAEASPSRSSVTKRRVLWLAGSLAWVALLLFALGLRRDLAALSPAYLAVWLVAPFVLGALGFAGALQPTRSGLGLPVQVSRVFSVVAPASVVIAALALSSPNVHEEASFVRAAATCLTLTLVGTLGPLAFAVFALRNAFPAGARSRAALVGAATGLFAGGALNLHCSFTSSFHMLLGHALPVALATLLGAFAASRWMRS